MHRSRFASFVEAAAILTVALTPSIASALDHAVCEDVRYATPGLYGLCIAYCEGLDCDDESFRAAACEPPRENVLGNYNRKKGATDPEMPCITLLGDEECPCFTAADLLELHPDSTCNAREEEQGNVLTLTGPNAAGCVPNQPKFDFAGASDFVRSDGNGAANTCFYRDVDESDCSVLGGRMADDTITLQQAVKCYQILSDFCDGL